ncbi:MAG TPA: bifunctional DNA-formamidopyrimidine glycosylase/DNA-(apurinic or apyrimidinic site) lyase [Desertimonas sp.]|nr:bifunctional DNA-formamidopyrimidine glycosylase/DNA-(apurinic or apyrimidinic site) lyase [Desertimonas sp.]
MPELPEVETVRRGLQRLVVGRRIDGVEVGRERTVRRTSRQALIDGLTGTSLVAAGRRGKYLLCPLDSGDVLMVHLRMTGQLLLVESGSARPLHTHVVLHLGDAELLFVDSRTFGEMVVYDPDHVDIELPEVARLGLDPLVDDPGPDELWAVLRGRSMRIKPLLLDQHVIAGIGNIYADEILHAARLHPETPASSLRRRDAVAIHEAMGRILNDSIRAGGSTLSDVGYVDMMGEGGSYQDAHLVYGRTGERCPTCGRGFIRRITSGGRSTHFCPVCQRPRT